MEGPVPADGAGPCRCLPRIDPMMHPPRYALPATRLAGAALLFATLAACGDRAPSNVPSLASNALLVEPLEAAWRQFNDPSLAAVEGDCNSGPTLAIALEGWLQGVEAAGLQSRFAAETGEARRRAAAIRSRCAATIAALQAATPAASERNTDLPRNSTKASRPDITPAMLDAYVRGMEEEIRLMRASGSHFVSLSKYDEEGRQVAATAGLSLPEYSALRQAVQDVLYAHMMHGLYRGPAGATRLAGLERHKREHAVEVLSRDPFAALSPAEREAMQARIGTLRPLYDRYMEIAAIAD